MTSDLNRAQIIIRLNQRLEEFSMTLNKNIGTLGNEMIFRLTSEMQPLYRKILMMDMDAAFSRQLENRMWNDCFKMPITQFGRTDKNYFNIMIESGVGFYMSLIQDVGLYFEIPFIANSTRNLYCAATSNTAKIRGYKTPSKTSIYYIIQNALLHTGDLLRYRGNLKDALKIYEKCAAVSQGNGHPWAQMGITQVMIDNKTVESMFSVMTYYVRALSVANPYVSAMEGLDSIISRIKQVSSMNTLDNFLCQFAIACGLPNSSTVTSNFESSLVTLLTNKQISGDLLFKITLVSLWAWKRESDKSLIGIDTNCESYALDIVASILNSFLLSISDQESAMEFYALPYLKILLDWIQSNSSVVMNAVFRSKFHLSLLCKLLNHLKNVKASSELPVDEYDSCILPEEKKLLGFLPLNRCYENLKNLIEEGERAKLMRIHRILAAGDKLCQPRLGFIQFNSLEGSYIETQPPPPKSLFPSSTSWLKNPPSRRNVALSSIFQHTSTPNEEESPIGSSNSPFLIEPRLPNSSTASSPASYCDAFKLDQDDHSPGSTSWSPESNDYSQLFRSIWTPCDDNDKADDGWAI